MFFVGDKADKADGKTQFCALMMLAGGVVTMRSSKLTHIGNSVAHNEYMALYFGHHMLVWMRQLLEEMGLTEMIAQPTVMLADNTAANSLSREDIVTTGNQYMYIYLPYHYNKEVQELGFSIVEHIRTKRNISDLGTKPVDRVTLELLLGPLTGYDTRLIQEIIKELQDKGLY